jgi:uncharacterized protein YdaU (DUF1376 family)
MAEFPALPLWTDAYMADTTHLSDAEHGRYLLLLVHLWRAPQQRLPNDNAWLARKFGRSEQAIENEWRPLIREFCQCDGNWITQKRLSVEFSYVKKLSAQRTEAVKSRWRKHKEHYERNTVTHGSRITPTPTPIIETLSSTESLARASVLAQASKEQKKAEALSGALPAGPYLPRAKLARGMRWPSTAIVPDAWRAMAGSARLAHGLPEIDLGLEAEKFTNYWSAKSGAGAAKVNWRRTWINWALNAKAPANGKGKPNAYDKFFAAGLSIIRNEATTERGSTRDQDDDPDDPSDPLLSA